MLLTD